MELTQNGANTKTTLEMNKTIRDIVVETPEATRIFESLKIDYCCGGHKAVGEACATANVKVADLELLLEEARQTDAAPENGTADFQKTSLAELITHILNKHHVYTKNELVRLEALLDKVIAAHGQNHPELFSLRELFQSLCADLRPHIFKEEQVLFPYIVEMERLESENRPGHLPPFGTVNNPIRMMMTEHDRAGEILRELRRVSSNYAVPGDVCISYKTLYQALEALESDLHQHIHLENNILFPRATEKEGQLTTW